MDIQMSLRQRWQQVVQGSLLWIFAIILALGMTLILSFNLVRPTEISVAVGQPAPNDIFAPRSLTYTSDVLTRERREQARANVSQVYKPLDLSIGRAQLNQARAVFSFIETVRADRQATTETKLNYLQSIEDVTVEEQVGLDLLGLSPTDYEVAREETLDIIDNLMRQEIREDQLSSARLSARRQASLNLTSTQNNVVTSLAPQFIVPTIFPDTEATTQEREEAVSAVEPVTRSIMEGTLILRAGDIVTEADLEMLSQLGLLQQEPDWSDVARIFTTSLLSVVIITLYMRQFHNKLRENGRQLAALAGLFLLFTLAAKLMVAGPTFLPYWFPIAALSMLLAVLFDVRLSILLTIIMAGLVGYIAPNSLELAVYIAAGGLMSALTLRDAQRINAFFRAGLIAAVV
jgi:membrane-associated HD superfamily phosphohydrolase